MNSTLLITGATGNVGRATVRALSARDPELEIRAATRKPEAYQAPAENVTAVRLDFNDPQSFAPALEGVDKLFLMSAPMDAGAAPKLSGLLDAAGRAGVKQVVLMTAMGVEHAPQSPLGQVETALKASGIDWTILRPNWFMDNFHPGFLGDMVKKGQITVPAADSKVSFIAAEDIGEAAAVTLLSDGHAGREYTLTGPESLSWETVAQKFTTETGRTVNYIPIGDDDMREALAADGVPEQGLDYMSMLFGAMRGGASAPVAGDIRGLIGREPRNLGEFTKKHKAAWK